MVNSNDVSTAAFVATLPDELQAAALVEQAAASAVEQHHQEQAQLLAAAQAAVAAAAAAASHHPNGEKKRKGGRQKDAVWQETTIVDGKEVVCNKCHTVIHRYGCTKVERVRAHFENKCVFTKRAKLHHDPHAAGGGGGPVAGSSAAGGAASGTGNGHGDVVVPEVPTEGKSARYRSEYANKMGVFKRRIAQWIYTSGHPFGEVKNGFLRNAFRTLRPDITLPTQYELENDLLDLESNASLAKVNRSLSGKACCLTLERWVDINGQTMTNFVAFSEGSPYFLETSPALVGSEKEFAVDEIERVLAKQKKAMTYGILTPLGDAVSKASREKIQKKYPHCVFYYGCIANALRLLMTDMCTILPWLGAIHDSILQMTTVFEHNATLGNLLRSMQHAESKPPLVIPDDDAGATICDALDSVLKSERELVALVSRRDFVEMGKTVDEQATLKRVQNFVLGDTFLQDVLNALNILHPLQQQLTRVQTERVAVSYVYHCFLELLAFYVQMEHVNKKDKALITSCVNERFNSIYGDCHGIAYLLDPVFLGVNMDEGKRHEIEEFIVACCTHVLHATGIDVLDQLERYRAMVQQLKECNHAYWELLVTGKVRPFDFWVERRQFPQLQQLAWIVFALPVASTVPGQTFAPSCALIHSRFHGQLPTDKLQKLTHVFCNAKFQQPEIKEPEPLLSIVLHDTEDPSSTLV